MSATRLALAAAAGLFDHEHGRVLAYRPPAETTLAPLVRDRTLVVEGVRPLYDRFLGDGWEVATAPTGEFATAIVFVPRERVRARSMIAEAAACIEGPIVVDGGKTDGVEALLRELRRRTRVGEVISKGHGKIFAFEGGHFDDWRAEPVTVDGFRIAPGLFSAEGVDRGSLALAEALPPLSGAVADLGAGWGYLAARVLAASPEVTQLHAVEAEHDAIACLAANLADPRVSLHWADATSWRPPAPLDAVVMNPPFHAGRRADPSIGRAFIAAAASMLGRRGSLWMVANRHLPYEDALRHSFHKVREIEGDSGFKLFHAEAPNAPMR